MIKRLLAASVICGHLVVNALGIEAGDPERLKIKAGRNNSELHSYDVPNGIKLIEVLSMMGGLTDDPYVVVVRDGVCAALGNDELRTEMESPTRVRSGDVVFLDYGAIADLRQRYPKVVVGVEGLTFLKAKPAND